MIIPIISTLSFPYNCCTTLLVIHNRFLCVLDKGQLTRDIYLLRKSVVNELYHYNIWEHLAQGG